MKTAKEQVSSAGNCPTSMNIAGNLQPYLNQNRNVYRAGWLRFIPFAELVPSDEHRFWVVFSVCRESVPFLEFYRERQNTNIANEGPVSKHSLETCRFVTIVITPKESRHHEFTIGLSSQNIRLSADTNEVMLDWINVLKSKLIQLNILSESSNKYVPKPDLPARNVPQTCVPKNNQTYDAYQTIFDTNRADNDEEPPPPYEVTLSSKLTNVSFREAQVENLKKQISNIDGIKLKVRRKDLLNSVAWTDLTGHGIFIVGWKQKQCPQLHDIFHIGDQIISINRQHYDSSDDARTYLKNIHSHHVELLLRRLPFGEIFLFQKSHDREDLGIICDNGISEIKDVKSDSIAAKGGLTSRCLFYFDDDHPNDHWYLTEINNRPLNLFFKNNEVQSRLNAVGKDISILVQPSRFVRKIQTQMKSHIKNYKEFLVQ